MAVVEEEEEDDDDDEGGGIRPEVAAGMLVEELVEELTVTADDGACSVIDKGCEVIPSEESAEEKRHCVKKKKKVSHR